MIIDKTEISRKREKIREFEQVFLSKKTPWKHWNSLVRKQLKT